MFHKKLLRNRARIDFWFPPVLSIFSWPRFILSGTALKDFSRHQNPLLEPVVWITNVSLNSVIYHLEPHLITRPASVNGLFPPLPRCQFTSTLWMLVCWKSSLGQLRSQGLPWCRCQALQSAVVWFRCGWWGWWWTSGAQWGQREWLMGAPASQVQCAIRHCRTECEHTKERWIASTECLFSVYTKWMDGRVEGFFFFHHCCPWKRRLESSV